MPAFVPGYQHDIFVSYAHVDDQPDDGVDKGWVTTLVESLRRRLATKLGRADAYSLWIDHHLSRHVDITPQIIETLRKTATLLIILSPGYVESPWCGRERETFLRVVEDLVRQGSRVFVVERDRLGEERYPEPFRNLLGYRFWVEGREGRAPRILGDPKPNPEDIRYYDLVNDLSHDLAEELRRLRTAAEPAESPPGSASSQGDGQRPVVFLAEVTDDLDPQRDEVRRHLIQAGLRVLPEHWYPREPNAFKQALHNDFSGSQVFVQLLSGTPGKKSLDLPGGYSLLQYDCAVSSGKPILQWRSPDLDLGAVADQDHRRLLERDTVLAVSMQEFKREVVLKATHRPAGPAPRHEYKFVFLNAEASDRSLVEHMGAALDKRGVAYAYPILEGKPADIRKDLERNLLDCDGLIIVYGSSTVDWVRDQLRYCRKVISKRDDPLHALGVFEGPPEEKLPLNFRLPNMQVINCRRGLNDTALESFLGAIGTEA